MSKIRNSLGVLVLPIPYEGLTIEGYKNRYGIDLNEIFAIRSGATRFKRGFSKLIALDTSELFPDGDAIPLSLVNQTMNVGTQLILPLSFEINEGEVIPSNGLAIDLKNDEVTYYEI